MLSYFYIAVKCLAPPEIEKSKPDFNISTADRSVGSKLTYTCRGVITTKKITVTCTPEGTWDVYDACKFFK